jgi:hypothetical protein
MVFMTVEKRQPRRAISTKHRKISTGLDLELYIVVETSSGSRPNFDAKGAPLPYVGTACGTYSTSIVSLSKYIFK